jgi:hypothetical protein
MSLSSFIPAADPLQETPTIQHDKRLGSATARKQHSGSAQAQNWTRRLASATLWVTDQGEDFAALSSSGVVEILGVSMSSAATHSLPTRDLRSVYS